MKTAGVTHKLTNLAWYSKSLDVLNPLRWHLNELIEEMESYNRYATILKRPTLSESKIQAAKAANEAANKFFSLNAAGQLATKEKR
jgi:hypothetical protein